ncbi:Putative transferase CAF17, mitochondrial [Wickerhamiella sorbophila]|uniref:Transferase CAF17, mitochondrial n=1 Tax=Wickerhamiella sorbophila TaxID=45607 RepID=A0A2T0FMG4_9ASCO|nr:Putative transferase CAF17, mitochondrial [Wickerhamiella sorbophila]PRT56165.1 Putative transferase CAF17, mitochondrial [Wickerhamiella sorbophila]
MLGQLKRLFSTTASRLALPQGVPVAGHLRLPRSLVAVSGPDSSKFLNGLLTIRPPDAPEGVSTGKYGAMLNSKGRVVFDSFIYPAHGSPLLAESLPGVDVANCYLLEVDTELADRALRVFNFYKLQSKITVSLAANLGVWFAWNDEADLDLGSVGETINNCRLSTLDERAPGLGARAIATVDPFENVGSSVQLDVYRLRRYLFGVPEGSAEIVPDKALPLEYCMDYMGGVEFDKGCYVGQELTIRTHHHGVVRKRVAPLVFTEPGEAIPEDLYIPHEMQVGPGDEIFDAKPLPNADALGTTPYTMPSPASQSASDSISPFKGSSPFPLRAGARPAGKVICTLGNVGLGTIRIDKLGHDFKIGDISVTGLTPYWWPESATE